jgi:hypothetical protein
LHQEHEGKAVSHNVSSLPIFAVSLPLHQEHEGKAVSHNISSLPVFAVSLLLLALGLLMDAWGLL